jgi:ribosomal protein S12 methylthiotransferase
MKKKRIRMLTMGCSKNLVDSEKVLGQLPPGRFELHHEGEGPADIVIINTCGFIRDAKEESIDTILHYVEARRQGLIGELLVTGCLSERYREELRQEIPEVDAWFGVSDTDALFARLRELHAPEDPSRLLATPSHYAYLKVAEGCDRSCSFCAIPMIRGRYRSLPVPALEKEARQLAGKGVRELLLIAQDLSWYGRDLQGRSLLTPLLESLSSIDGIRWIRLHYAYPALFPQDLIRQMADNPKLCRYLDIPFQHIHDGVLRSMRRGHTRRSTYRLIEKLRGGVPGLALRTTLMVGYPGETDAAFEELMQFVREVRFERMGVFTYSPEEGTPAYPLGDPVPETVKLERADALMALQQEISMEINESRIGQVHTVVIDSEDGDYFLGRTEFDSPEVDNEVFLDKSPGMAPGDFVRAEITGAGEFELYGRLAVS